jgi:hypothetical protein
MALGQDRVVGGVPRDSQALGDQGDGESLAQDALHRPPWAPARKLGSRVGERERVLVPHVFAATATLVRGYNAPGRDRTVMFEPLSQDVKTVLVQKNECGQLRAGEGTCK